MPSVCRHLRFAAFPPSSNAPSSAVGERTGEPRGSVVVEGRGRDSEGYGGMTLSDDVRRAIVTEGPPRREGVPEMPSTEGIA